MDETRNRVLEDKKKLEEMQKEWDHRYPPVSTRGAKENARMQLRLQKEIERKYRNRPLNVAERRELRMLSTHNNDISRKLRPGAWELSGRAIRAVPRVMFRGAGLLFGLAAAIVVGVAGLFGKKVGGGQRRGAPFRQNQNRYQVMPRNSVGGKAVDAVKRNYGYNKHQQRRAPQQQGRGLGL